MYSCSLGCSWGRSRNMCRVWRTTGVVPVRAHLGRISSVGFSRLPQLSHWSPRASCRCACGAVRHRAGRAQGCLAVPHANLIAVMCRQALDMHMPVFTCPQGVLQDHVEAWGQRTGWHSYHSHPHSVPVPGKSTSAGPLNMHGCSLVDPRQHAAGRAASTPGSNHDGQNKAALNGLTSCRRQGIAGIREHHSAVRWPSPHSHTLGKSLSQSGLLGTSQQPRCTAVQWSAPAAGRCPPAS